MLGFHQVGFTDFKSTSFLKTLVCGYVLANTQLRLQESVGVLVLFKNPCAILQI